MRDPSRRPTTVGWLRLGRCASCVRKALWASAFAWLLTATIYITGAPHVLPIATICSTSLSALWCAHLLSFAHRAASGRRKIQNDGISSGRRKTTALFLRAFAFIALASVLPRVALADGSCGGEDCDRCERPVYDGTGHWTCELCHSCTDDEGNECGGSTC